MNVLEQCGWRSACQQIRFLAHELKLLTCRRSVRWLVLFFEPSAGVLISYRLDRCGYLLCGPLWTGLRVLFFPVWWFFRLLGCRHEICYKAEIGRGFRVLHPTLGVVVNGDAIVGENCLLNGGNSIGVRRGIQRGELVLGDNVVMGINACVLGPAIIGDGVIIGAGAVVVTDLVAGSVAVGVPARPLSS